MRTRDEMMVAEVASRKHDRILDIGYAQYPIPELMKFGGEVYGVDLVEWPSPYTKTFICDLNNDPLPFENESIDAVTMGCTLAHLARPLKLLAEVQRVLRPGGVLILTSPNPHYYWEAVLNIFYNRFKKRVSKSKHIEHFFEFTRYTMRTSLERTGFTLVKELGSTFHLVKFGWKFDVEKYPALAFEIIYVAEKTGKPDPYTIIEDAHGDAIRLTTDLFS